MWQEILNDLENLDRCYESFRMEHHVFKNFVDLLRGRGLLKNTRRTIVEESRAMFLLTISQNDRNCAMTKQFQHSTWTINTHIKKVVRAICKLGKELITSPSFTETPTHIRRSERYFPMFKDCVGDIDGTHVSAYVPHDKKIPFRGKKKKLLLGQTSASQNLLQLRERDALEVHILVHCIFF
ncbi:PREDICTED: uncharacterized protein LOC104612277 isoform X2 [Nelumbo nucifera]|uniref:Uncharacterized protein LOC104612277 isoform X2 n=1 Tax=Nelumbo nucifera TaxID=4432 RepID=A0A1U8BL08_NELNU|nr:PREDICTED: uncharacterized protein LOC104612277 isoform X2 [Nelumbo nucifera]